MSKLQAVKTALGLAIAGLCFGSAQATPSVTSGLVGAWEFSGNTNDTLGTHNGTNHGATLTTDRSGAANSAYDFDGVNDYIDLPSLSLNSPSTISFWVRPDTLSNDVRLLSNISGSTTGNSLSIRYSSNRLEIWNNAWLAMTSSPLSLGSWTNITVTLNNKSSTTYINGIQALSTTDATNYTMYKLGAGAPLQLAHGKYFDGKIDDLFVYNRILNASEITSLAAPIPEPENMALMLAGLAALAATRRAPLARQKNGIQN